MSGKTCARVSAAVQFPSARLGLAAEHPSASGTAAPTLALAAAPLRGCAMADNETAERWTVPQASVWIRTRDLATVRELGPRIARSLAIAADAMPDVLTASACLVAALRAGRIRASGRLARTGDASDLGEERETIPPAFWHAGADLSDDLDRGVMARELRRAARWLDLDIEANACIGRWQPPAAILGEGVLSLGQAAGKLEPEPIDRLRWLLTHPAVIVTGLNDRAERVTVDAAALALGVADIEADTVTTRDGRICWSQVTVELAPAAGAATPPAAPLARIVPREYVTTFDETKPSMAPAPATTEPPRRRGPPARRRGAVADWITKHRPEGVAGETIASLQAAMKADTAACADVRNASEDTIRRALHLKK